VTARRRIAIIRLFLALAPIIRAPDTVSAALRHLRLLCLRPLAFDEAIIRPGVAPLSLLTAWPQAPLLLWRRLLELLVILLLLLGVCHL
jgi:hypothetical protein